MSKAHSAPLPSFLGAWNTLQSVVCKECSPEPPSRQEEDRQVTWDGRATHEYQRAAKRHKAEQHSATWLAVSGKSSSASSTLSSETFNIYKTARTVPHVTRRPVGDKILEQGDAAHGIQGCLWWGGSRWQGEQLAAKGVGLFHFWPVGSQVVVLLLRFFSKGVNKNLQGPCLDQ